MKPERNGFKTEENIKKLEAVKQYAFIPDIETNLIKQRTKELSTDGQKVTFNDILMTAISKSLHDYQK